MALLDGPQLPLANPSSFYAVRPLKLRPAPSAAALQSQTPISSAGFDVKRTLQIAAVDVAVGGTWSFVNEQHLLR
jgi:hypothetical protein